jgi:hypothetical protein
MKTNLLIRNRVKYYKPKVDDGSIPSKEDENFEI